MPGYIGSAEMQSYRHPFFKRLGFEMIYVRKRYYGPTGEDALVMAKILKEAS